jgi:hypothetical protein
MENEDTDSELIDAKIFNCIKQFEKGKEQRLIELIIEILVMSTLREYHEKSNQIF